MFAGVVMLPFVYLHLVGGADQPQDWYAAASAQISADFSFQRPIQILFALWLVLPLAWLVLGASFLACSSEHVRNAKLQAIAACVLALASTFAYSWQTAMIFGLPAFFALSRYRASVNASHN